MLVDSDIYIFSSYVSISVFCLSETYVGSGFICITYNNNFKFIQNVKR